MQSNKRFQTKVIIGLSYIFLLFASACSSSSIEEATATLVPPTTKVSTSTAVPPTTKASTSTQAPPTTVPTPTTAPSIYPFAMEEPDPNAELEYGPWVFYQVDPQYRDGNIAYQNLRGSITSLLDDPSWMGDFEIYLGAEFSRILLPSPEGDRVAFYVIKENKAQVWVFDVVSKQIDAKIELFFTETDEDPSQILDRYLWRQKMMQWSPDGNYLAVVAGLESSEHSLLLYDFAAHERLVVAEHVQHLGLVDWSPDSHSVVYVSLPTLGPSVAYGSIWAATIEGYYLPIGDMSPSYMTVSLGWTDFSTIIIEDRHWESPAANLRSVNVNTGQIRPVFDDFYMDAFLLTDMQLLFYNIFEGSIYFPEDPTEMEQGVYIKDFGEGPLELLLPSNSAYLFDWFPEIENFLIFEGDTAYFYNLDGEIVWETKPTRYTYPSPDGKYILIIKDSQLKIHDPHGTLIWSSTTSSLGRVLWLPDSSGFIQFEGSDIGKILSLHLENENWKGSILDNVIWTEYSYLYFILE